MQNKGYCAIPDHSMSPMSVPIESLYATSYQWLLIITEILSRTISELSQIIGQFLDKKMVTCIFEPHLGA